MVNPKDWMKKMVIATFCLVLLFWFPEVSKASEFGKDAFSFLNTINNSYPGREAGNANCIACGDWINGQMQSWGYQTQVHSFTTTTGGAGRNLFYVKPGISEREIVIGAHYDSDPITKGADDNGSGVAVVLELAKKLANKTLPCTLRIIFWDEEECGMMGSVKYLQTYGVGNAMCIINIDSIAAGDIRYVHGGGGNGEAESPWLRDLSLQISAEHGLNMTTHPGLPSLGDVAAIPAGTRVTGSDQMHWAYSGVPYIYCEASLYSTAYGNPVPNKVQTANSAVPMGQIMHSPFDDMGKITALFGNRTEGHLSAYSLLCYELLTRLQPDKALAPSTLIAQPVEPVETTPEQTTIAETTEEETTEEETTEEVTTEAETTEEEILETEEAKREDDSFPGLWLIGGIFGIILILLAVAAIMMSPKRRK